ncbi:transporter substrate-binding domain-containing protein [Desulfuromonas thiophila]|uniref:transporter substrate-binding domain-containing protein n=1 Tax=Desulfuromonas thiophila TaxID=57664 RepID=UPI0024A8813A|nr:transporter substrate-binding domain-containing protein [Desulfuromonas thiophila]
MRKLIILILLLSGCSSPSLLTPEEQAYLESKQSILFHNEKDWKPYDYFEDGTPKGFCIDVVRLIAKKIGFEARLVSGQNWNRYMQMLENKNIDALHNTAITPDRERYMIFTDSYVQFRDALFVHKERHDIKGLEDLQGKTLAVVRGYYQEVLLKSYYPEINLLPVENTTQCIKAVSEKTADAAINEVGVSNSFINNYGVQDVVLESFIQDKRFNLDLHFAVHKDNKILRDILQKGLDAISAEEMAVLKKKWLILGPKQEIDYTLLGSITLGIMLLLGLLTYRARLLKAHNMELRVTQTALQREIHQKELLLRELNHRVKNNLQIVQSIISLKTSRKDPSRFIEEIESNIQAISLAYDKLIYLDAQDSVELQSYLHTLASYLARSVGQQVQIETNIADIKIGIQRAVTLGLIITECFNNSVKYAFGKSTVEPRFFIRMRVETPDNLLLTIADNGPGFASTIITGIGRELITSLCHNDFHTTPRFYNDQGAAVDVLMPIS